jgi:hypothetical protein
VEYFEAFDSYFPEANVEYDGSHMAMSDDQKTYVDGVVKFIRDVDEEHFR